MTASGKTSAGRLEWLDVLRGIASLGVALFHAMIPLWLGLAAIHSARIGLNPIERLGAFISIPIHYGYDGVMLFFVLSGFVIHLPYAGARRRFEFAPYVVRRFLRLYPPYLAAIGASVLVIALTSHGKHIIDVTDVKSVFLAQNYPHGGGPTAELAALQPAGNIALWSLPVEFELYLVYPLLLIGLSRFGMRAMIVVVASFSFASAFVDTVLTPQQGQPASWASYFPTFSHYLVVWASGAWLAEQIVAKRLPKWSVVYGIFLACVLCLTIFARHPLGFSRDAEDYVAAMLSFMILLGFATHPRLVAVFDNPILRPLRTLGMSSYSLYLVHMPFFLFVAFLVFGPDGHKSRNYFISAAAAIVAVPVAYVFYLCFERPSIAFARRLSQAIPTTETALERLEANPRTR